MMASDWTHFLSQTVDSLAPIVDLHPHVAVRVEECNTDEMATVRNWASIGIEILLQSGVSRLADLASQKNGAGASDIYANGVGAVSGGSALSAKYAQYLNEIGASMWGAMEFELGTADERERWRSQFRDAGWIIPVYNPAIDSFRVFEKLANQHHRVAIIGLSLLSYDAVISTLQAVNEYRQRGVKVHLSGYPISEIGMAYPVDSIDDRKWSDNVRYGLTLTYAGLRQYGDAKALSSPAGAGRRGNKIQRSRALRVTAYQMNIKMRSMRSYYDAVNSLSEQLGDEEEQNETDA